MNMLKQCMMMVVLAVLFLGNASCTSEFESYNTDKNGLANPQPAALIPQMQLGIYYPKYVPEFQLQQNLVGDVFAQHQMAPAPFRGNDNNMTYGLVDGWNTYPFFMAYRDVVPQWLAVAKALKTSSPEIYAVATVVKVGAMHRLADMYGPLPYKSMGAAGSSFPYDDLQTVYKTMFEELNDAIQKLNTYLKTQSTISELTIHDKIYSGNVSKWIKFANSLKLRLAMRTVKVQPALAQTYAEEAVAGGVMETNDDNAFVVQQGVIHPLKVINDDWNDIRMGASMESILKGYNDPRIGAYFQKSSVVTPADYKGIRIGINIKAKDDYQGFSKLTTYFANTNALQIMVASEIAFLRAEGKLRGWNVGAKTAKEYYEEGVALSFAQWNVGSPTTYLAGTTLPVDYVDPKNSDNNISAVNDVPVSWDEADNNEVKLQKIITQKWIALYPDGQEAWSEYRRTRYPKLFPAKINYSKGTISSELGPRRLNFPQTDKNTNEAEVEKATLLLGGKDNGGTRLWWDVDKPNF